MSENLVWRKASYSSGQGGNCVEIAALPDRGMAVRDSKDPNGAVILLTSGQWAELVKTLLRQPKEPPVALSRPEVLLCLPTHSAGDAILQLSRSACREVFDFWQALS